MVFITKVAAALVALLATSTEALRPAVTPTMSTAPKTPGRRDFLRLGSAVAVSTLAGVAPANAVKELCKSRAAL